MTHTTKHYTLTHGKAYLVVHLPKADAQTWFASSRELTREYCESVDGTHIVCELRDNRYFPIGETGSFSPRAIANRGATTELIYFHINAPKYKIGGAIWFDATRTDNGISVWICTSCGHGANGTVCERDGVPDDAVRCDVCNKYIWGDNAQKFHICKKCLTKILEKQYNYHGFTRRGELLFTNPERRAELLHMGFELEMHNIQNADAQRTAREFSRNLNPNPYKRYAHFEFDGSLVHSGIEIITEPCTIKSHAKQIDAIKKVFDIARARGYKTETTNGKTCGFHVHFDREYFGGYNKSRYTGLRLAYLVEVMFDRELSAINGRHGNTSFCEKYGITENDDPLIANDKMRGGHSVSVNISNDNTIELRIWGDAHSPEIVLAYLDVSSALAKLARATTYDKLPKTRFEHLGKYLTFAETPATLKDMGLDASTTEKLLQTWQNEYRKTKKGEN